MAMIIVMKTKERASPTSIREIEKRTTNDKWLGERRVKEGKKVCGGGGGV